MSIIKNLSRAALVAGLLTTFGQQAAGQKTLEAKLSQYKAPNPDAEGYNFSSLYRALSLEENKMHPDSSSGRDPYGKAYKSLALKFSGELTKLAGRYGVKIDEMTDKASYEMFGGIGAFTFLNEIVLEYWMGNSSSEAVDVTLVFYPNDVVLENLRNGGNDNYRRIKAVKLRQPDNSIKLIAVSLPVNPDFPYQNDMEGYDFWQVHDRAKEIRRLHDRSSVHHLYVRNQYEKIVDFMFKRYGINPTSFNGNDDLLFAGNGMISISYYTGNQKYVLHVKDKLQATIEAVGVEPGLISPKIVLPVPHIK